MWRNFGTVGNCFLLPILPKKSVAFTVTKCVKVTSTLLAEHSSEEVHSKQPAVKTPEFETVIFMGHHQYLPVSVHFSGLASESRRRRSDLAWEGLLIVCCATLRTAGSSQYRLTADLNRIQSILDYSPLSMSAIKIIRADFRNSTAFDSPPRLIIRHPRLSASLFLVPTVAGIRWRHW